MQGCRGDPAAVAGASRVCQVTFHGADGGVLDPGCPWEVFSLLIWCLHLSLWGFCAVFLLLLKEIRPLTCVLRLLWGHCSFHLLVVGLTLWGPSFAVNNVLIQPITNALTDAHINVGLLLLRMYPGLFITCLCHSGCFHSASISTSPPALFLSPFLSPVRSLLPK